MRGVIVRGFSNQLLLIFLCLHIRGCLVDFYAMLAFLLNCQNSTRQKTLHASHSHRNRKLLVSKSCALVTKVWPCQAWSPSTIMLAICL